MNQVNGEYATKDVRMIVQEIRKSFEYFKISQVPRGFNTEADALANLDKFEAIPY